MLVLERRGEAYSKAERRRALKTLLEDRSESAIEKKHQNISAVLIDADFPYIDGYKPLFNYQALLREVVQTQILARPDVGAAIEAEMRLPPTVPSMEDILLVLVDPPASRRGHESARVSEGVRPRYGRGIRDYVAVEARNAQLGRAGEEFAIRLERARLIAAGRERLAERVEHVAVSRGDAEGYDVLSFDTQGRERLIEVKTTAYGMYTPFYVSPNELAVSKREAGAYHVYRLYDFRQAPRLFMLRGAIDRVAALEPSQFRARVG